MLRGSGLAKRKPISAMSSIQPAPSPLAADRALVHRRGDRAWRATDSCRSISGAVGPPTFRGSHQRGELGLSRRCNPSGPCRERILPLGTFKLIYITESGDAHGRCKQTIPIYFTKGVGGASGLPVGVSPHGSLQIRLNSLVVSGALAVAASALALSLRSAWFRRSFSIAVVQALAAATGNIGRFLAGASWRRGVGRWVTTGKSMVGSLARLNSNR
jgi:hypothetical protein